jgi:hypothetical protein
MIKTTPPHNIFVLLGAMGLLTYSTLPVIKLHQNPLVVKSDAKSRPLRTRGGLVTAIINGVAGWEFFVPVAFRTKLLRVLVYLDVRKSL